MDTFFQKARQVSVAAVAGSALVVTLGLGAFVPSASAATCPELSAGTRFKVMGNSAVYLLNAEKKRMYFPNEEVYNTWYTSFTGTVTIEQSCVENYPPGGGVNYRPGSRLVKSTVTPSVYAIGPDNKKYKIANENVAKALYGPQWSKLVRVLPDHFDANLEQSTPLTEAKISINADGLLIKKAGSSDIYLVSGGKLKKVNGVLPASSKNDVRIVSAAVFASAEIDSSVVDVSDLTSDPTQRGGIKVDTTVKTNTTVIPPTTPTTPTNPTTPTTPVTPVNNSNYNGPFPAPEGMVLTGTVGNDTYSDPTGAGPYKFRVQTDWKRPTACLDSTRVRIGSKGMTWEKGWMAGYNAGNAQFRSLIPKYNNTPTGSGAGSALYNEGYKIGYDHGWNDQTSVSTEYNCPSRAKMSAAEIKAQYDEDGWWKSGAIEGASGLSFAYPQGSSVLNSRSNQQVPGHTIRIQGNSETEGPHTTELNKSLKPVNVDYIDFSVDTVGAQELSLGVKGVLQALYNDIKKKDATALCATSEPTIVTNTFGSNEVTLLDFYSACDVDGSSKVDIAWIPRHYAIIKGANNRWLTMFFSNNNDIGNAGNTEIDMDKYVNSDFVVQFLKKIKFQ